MNLADLLTTATLGDYAPAVRRLQIDYKVNNRQNRHTDTVTLASPGVTDAALVRSVREHIEAVGGRLSAVWETRENGLPRCLYVIPGFLEESVREMGLSVPADPVAAMERVG